MPRSNRWRRCLPPPSNPVTDAFYSSSSLWPLPHRSPAARQNQIELLEKQLEIAKKMTAGEPMLTAPPPAAVVAPPPAVVEPPAPMVEAPKLPELPKIELPKLELPPPVEAPPPPVEEPAAAVAKVAEKLFVPEMEPSPLVNAPEAVAAAADAAAGFSIPWVPIAIALVALPALAFGASQLLGGDQGGGSGGGGGGFGGGPLGGSGGGVGAPSGPDARSANDIVKSGLDNLKDDPTGWAAPDEEVEPRTLAA